MSGKITVRGRVVLPDMILDDGAVSYENGVITAVGRFSPEIARESEVIDCGKNYVSPGFVDLHLHGGGGHDFMDGTVEAFLGAARLHAEHGTTSMLPTTLSCSDEELFRFLDTYKVAKKQNTNGADMIGVHLEGPYFAISQKGAQDEKYIVPPVKEHYEKILSYSDDIVRWTAASELPGALQFGREVSQKGILVSLGHSDAMYEDAKEAISSGYSMLTHFYSGMGGLKRINSYRYPGLIDAGYMLDFTVELIADGCHLPISLLEYIPKVKGVEKVTLCTDSSRGAGLPDGENIILGSLANGQSAIIEDGVAKLPDRSAFAGSVATTDRLVRNMYKKAGFKLTDAVRMMTLTPADAVKNEKKGKLEVGRDADIVVFDDDINIMKTIVRGNTIFEK